MGLIKDKYFKSEAIKVFPASYRRKDKEHPKYNFAPSAEQLTEFNLLRVGGKLNYTDSYVIDYAENESLICVIGGYYFEIDFVEAEITAASLAGKYLCITIDDDKRLSSFESGSTNLDNDINSNGTFAFTGLKVTDDPTGSSASIKPFNEDNAIDYTLKLPSVSAGSSSSDNAVVLNNSNDITNKASGDASFAHGANTEASGEASHAEGYNTKASGKASHAEGEGTVASRDNQTVVGKYNKEEDGEFIIGAGSVTDKKNALVVNGDTTTIRENLYVKNDTDTILKATKTETVIDSNKAKILATETAEIIAADETNIVSGAIEFSTPLDENEKQDKVSISSGKIDIATKSGKHLTIDDANDNIKLCLHKDANGKSKGKLILDLDDNNKTRAELNAVNINLEGNTSVNGTLNSSGKLTVGDTDNTPGADINGAVQINGTATISDDVTITGDIGITGATTINGNLTVSSSNSATSDFAIIDSKEITLGKTEENKSSIKITNKVLDNVETNTVDIKGDTTVSKNFTVAGDISAKTNIVIGKENAHASLSYNGTNAAIDIKIGNAAKPDISLGKATNTSTGILVGDTELHEKVKDLIIKSLFDSFYPVGAFYISYSINNNTINTEGKWGCPIADIGGYWEKVQDTFLYAACDAYPWSSTADTRDPRWPWPNPKGSNDAIVVTHTHNAGTFTIRGKFPGVGDKNAYSHLQFFEGPFYIKNGDDKATNNSGTIKVANSGDPDFHVSFEALGPDGVHELGSTVKNKNDTTANTIKGETGYPIIDHTGEDDPIYSEKTDGKDKNMPRYICVYMWRRVA